MDAKVDTGMDAAQDSAIMDRATDLAGDAERRLPAANAGGHFRHAAWDSGLGVYDPPGDTLTSDRGLPASGIGNRYLFRLQKG